MKRSNLRRTPMKRTTPIKRTTFKRRIASKHKLDAVTSLAVRARDNWTCVRCHRQWPVGDPGLTCSHFHGRSKQSVRHHMDNLDSLCATVDRQCHQIWEHQKFEGGEYDLFKRKQLGPERFEALRVLAQMVKIKYDL